MQEDDTPPQYDVIIVGGGPAGLSAALVLGRCRRGVLLVDAGEPRNASAKIMHGFISRDGESPREFLRIAREQLRTYPNVEFRKGRITHVQRAHEEFTVSLEDGNQFTSRIVLLATGIADEVPTLRGIENFYGATVHLCPYCHGWEHRDQQIVVYGRGIPGAEFCLEMLGWSRKLVYCTDGPSELPREYLERLERFEIPVDEEPVAQLEGEGDQIRGVRFESGRFRPCSALFFSSTQSQCSDLARELGCELDEEGALIEHCDNSSNIPGLYVAGNTCTGLQLVIMAAAGGTQAAFSINQALIEADVQRADAALARSKPVPEPNIVMSPAH